jgi:glyoxylase-like metal-dependent hydrolase (beta-lactamase superfamily II)/ferredoxin
LYDFEIRYSTIIIQMAELKKRLSGNVEGLFFVDSTCIDCDTCRQLAPEVFAERGNYSVVLHQPENDREIRESARALLSCPTGSIGTCEKIDLKQARLDFPLEITDGIFYNGFVSPDSFGASSYFISHPDGNWLIDSPKYLPYLRDRFAEMGGIKHIFLTHRDDVCDAARYAEAFTSERIIHQYELSAQPDAERVIEGYEPIRLSEDFLIIPTPGHTRGHLVLLYKSKYLFSGDHLWWSRNRQSLTASQSVSWYSWPMQIESVRKLLEYDFEWVLPGHGERVHMENGEMKKRLGELVHRIEQ